MEAGSANRRQIRDCGYRPGCRSPAANGPSAIKPYFTDVERRAFAEILAFAKDPANVDMELLRFLDAAGTSEHGRSTGRKAAPFTPEMDAAIAAEGGVRKWHNHPSQDSLSHQDWLCAGLSETVEVLALNANGSIFVGRIVEWDDRLHDLLPWLPNLWSDAYADPRQSCSACNW